MLIVTTTNTDTILTIGFSVMSFLLFVLVFILFFIGVKMSALSDAIAQETQDIAVLTATVQAAIAGGSNTFTAQDVSNIQANDAAVKAANNALAAVVPGAKTL